jgi:hypothetical protein
MSNGNLTVIQIDSLLHYLKQKRNEQLKLEIGDEICEKKDLKIKQTGKNSKNFISKSEKKNLFEKLKSNQNFVQALKTLRK